MRTGTPINEPEDFVTDGKQPLESEAEETTFAHDWQAGFYGSLAEKIRDRCNNMQ